MQCEEKNFCIDSTSTENLVYCQSNFPVSVFSFFPLETAASFGSSICVQSYNAKIYQFFLYIFESEFLNLLVKCV